jgi:hypothetical protein
MAPSTQRPVVVARVSFESTRHGPHCLAETYARIVPIRRELVRAGAKTEPEPTARPTATGRAEHG